MKNVDKVMEILRKTNDGNDLSWLDLKLTEIAVQNPNRLSAAGQEAFDALYERIAGGSPQPTDQKGTP